jgi:predicted deacylase
MTKRLTLLILLFCAGASFASAEPYCSNDRFAIDVQFDGADLDACEFVAEDSVVLTFFAEDPHVDTAFSWFAFRVFANNPDTLRIRLRFPEAYARFEPKVSADGVTWETVPADTLRRSSDGKVMDLQVRIGAAPVWVSAQELLTQDFYDDWHEALEEHDEISADVIGNSAQGRPVVVYATADKPEYVVLLGRQHPAEVPGAIAMRIFVDTVLADSALARRFRDRFGLVIVPLVNPDGVANGHWRHNAGGTDLNRDWGPFTQPETRGILTLLDERAKRGLRPSLMLDFHATKETDTMVFYTQMPEDDTLPERFASRWLGAVDARIDTYDFLHDPRPPSGDPNTKHYFFTRWGIPAITYEIGDEAHRGNVIEHTPVFAEEMMRVLLRP